MNRRQTTESIGFGAILQVLVVGVLLFAVVWQFRGTVPQDSPYVEATAPAAEDQAPVTPSFLTTDDVNLRRGPGTDHEVISVVPVHAEVRVTGGSMNGFVPVDIGGTSAWIAENYLVPEGTVLGGTSGDLPVMQSVDPPPAEEPVMAANTTTAVQEEPVTVAQTVEEPPVALSAQSAQSYEAPVEETVIEEPGERWVEVNRSTATVTLHEGNRIVAQFQGLIGKDPSPDGYYSTAVGTFQVHTMTRELAETPFAPGVYLTHFVGFDPARSNGFHSPTRDADGNVVQTGGTSTLGCVRLGEADAIQMFEFAHIGMRVEIHD